MPTSPVLKILGLTASRAGIVCPTALSLPPTIIAKVPAVAPAGPPETGASTKEIPLGNSSAICLVMTGSPVVMSQMMPVSIVERRPFEAKMTSRTSLDVGRHKKMTSAFAPISATVDAV